MCVGICVLLAIVYVLTRSGDSDPGVMLDGTNTNTNTKNNAVHNNMRAEHQPNGAVPPNTATVPQVQVQHEKYHETYPLPAAAAATATATATAASTTSTTTATTPVLPSPATTATPACDCPDLEDPVGLMTSLREKALANTPPHIIECAEAEAGESQAACHLSKKQRYAALGQKGATLWMTGCSGAGKTTIATALEDILVKTYGKHVYRLDGDNLRTGLNRDLGFSEGDRAESVRRTGELATLFSDAGVITLVGLISPYRGDRDAVRKRHEDQGIPFYEVFLDVPVEELMNRDPKGQYAKVASGELKHFTCIDDPYEEPLNAEITLRTHELEIQESANILLHRLERDGVLMGAPKVTPPGLPNPDGDLLVDLHVPADQREAKTKEAETLPKALITDIDLNWLQTIGEGWAAPLQGFMREGTLLETLHFNSVLVDPFNVTGNKLRLETKTDFEHFPQFPPTNRVSMPIPITLSATEYTKARIEESDKTDVALVTRMGKTVAILRNVEIYNNRKEEIVTRMFGVIDMQHPYIANIYNGGDYLLGGEVELLDRITYNDGLDQWRKTVQELLQEFQDKGADTVYAFQTRNPTHAGHAYLMKSAGEDLKTKGYRKPILWLSPLGGWTKSDDVPLDVRVKQHEQVLEAGISHPGGLDPATTVMAIWPAPMVYGGPTEVQFHAKSRRCAGASYFVVGRDPAGMKGSPEAVAHPDDDLYDGDHGRYVLQNSPGIGDMKMLSFVKVMYDITDNTMKLPDESRMDDFISISGSKMRLLARNGAVPCAPDNIPTDLVAANCVPSGFMVPKGWDHVVDYYKNIQNTTRWIPWSQPHVEAPASAKTSQVGKFGFTTFSLSTTEYASWWHDVPLRPSGESETSTVINMITEIPMYMTAKMEVDKSTQGNPIRQDLNKDGSPRYYTYGTPFFNYGLIPQTWEDPDVKSGSYGGDNDPIDVLEFGSVSLEMGSITPCRVIGSLELIDEGETDHKIMCMALSDPDAGSIKSIEDLERVKPGYLDMLRDWLKRYKTSDGKPENSLASETPRNALQALEVIVEVNQRWQTLCGKDGSRRSSLSSKTEELWLGSPGCRGE
jgi:3'-phosphoadenosine 5'-phosphosulfate synthase